MAEQELKELGRDDILNATDTKIESVPVPEWGGSVLVKGMTGEERDSYEQSIMILRKNNQYVPNLANARAKLVARTVVDKEGKRLFRDEDVKRLGEKSAAALQRVFMKARELSGLTEDDMEEMLGNSEEDQSEGSTSD